MAALYEKTTVLTGLTGVIGVRLQAVDHMVVGLEQHDVFRCVSVPDENVSTV